MPGDAAHLPQEWEDRLCTGGSRNYLLLLIKVELIFQHLGTIPGGAHAFPPSLPPHFILFLRTTSPAEAPVNPSVDGGKSRRGGHSSSCPLPPPTALPTPTFPASPDLVPSVSVQSVSLWGPHCQPGKASLAGPGDRQPTPHLLQFCAPPTLESRIPRGSGHSFLLARSSPSASAPPTSPSRLAAAFL